MTSRSEVVVTCPRCGGEASVMVAHYRGDLVPYGSTTARLPDTVAAMDHDHICPEPPPNHDEQTALDCSLYDAAEAKAQDDDGPSAADWRDAQWESRLEK